MNIRGFVVALTPAAAFEPTRVDFSFDCDNTDPAPQVQGTIPADGTPTFSFFLDSEQAVPFAPGENRAFVELRDAASYLRNFISWARARNVAYFYFEAFDESWKVQHEGPQGVCWGIWDKNATTRERSGLRLDHRPLVPRRAAGTQLNHETTTHAEPRSPRIRVHSRSFAVQNLTTRRYS